MADKVLLLFKQNRMKEMVQLVKAENEAMLAEWFRSKLDEFNFVHALQFLHAVQQTFENEIPNIISKRKSSLFVCYLKWMASVSHDVRLDEHDIGALSDYFANELKTNADAKMIVESCTVILDAIRSSRAPIGNLFSFLSSLTRVLDKCSNVAGGYDGVSGSAFKDYLIDRICSTRWPLEIVVPLSSSFVEMDITSKQLDLIVSKFLLQLPNLKHEEVPPLCYQLLLLSKKGCKRVILNGIIHFLSESAANDEAEEHSKQSISLMRGTVIVHILFAMKQDLSIGTEFLNLVKSDKVFSSTTIAVILAMARIHRFENAVIEIFQTNAKEVIETETKLATIQWMSDEQYIRSIDLFKLMDSLIENSDYGWDQVIYGAIKVAFTILDSSTVKKSDKMKDISDVAIETLLRIYQVHEVVRADIINEALSRITNRDIEDSPSVHLLSRVLNECPNGTKYQMAKIREVTDYLYYLPCNVGLQLLSALVPIMESDNQFMNEVLLILKKGLFRTDVSSRLIAVQGILITLKIKLKRCNGVMDRSINELFGCLRRCYQHQPSVRQILFEGLWELVHMFPFVSKGVANFLHIQLVKFLPLAESPNDFPSFNPHQLVVQSATSSLDIAEAIPALIRTFAKAVIDSEENNSAFETRYYKQRDLLASNFEYFLSIVNRFGKFTLQDLQIDESDLSSSTSTGKQNLLAVYLLRSIYETLIEHGICEKNIHHAMILNLFEKKLQMDKLLGGQEKIFSTLFANSSDLQKENSYAQCLCTFFENSEYSKMFRDTNFTSWVIEHLLTINEFKDARMCTQMLDLILKASRLVSNQNSQASTLIFIMETVCILSKSAVLRGTTTREQLFCDIICDDYFMQSIKDLLSDPASVKQYSKSITRYFNCIGDLLSHRMISSESYKGFLDVLITSGSVSCNSNVTKATMRLTGPILKQQSDWSQIELLTRELLCVYGKHEHVAETNDMDAVNDVRIVTKSTVSVITSLVLDTLLDMLADIDWCIIKLTKLRQNVNTTHVPLDEKARNLEKALLEHLHCVCKILFLFTQATCYTQSDFVFKCIESLLKCMVKFIKYKQLEPPGSCSVNKIMIDVVSIISQSIIPGANAFIMYVQQVETESAKENTISEQTKGAALKLDKRAKPIPAMVYQMEVYDGALLSLTKKSKINFTRYSKRSAMRDFRIQLDQLMEMDDVKKAKKSKLH